MSTVPQQVQVTVHDPKGLGWTSVTSNGGSTVTITLSTGQQVQVTAPAPQQVQV